MERDSIREGFWAAFDAFIPGTADTVLEPREPILVSAVQLPEPAHPRSSPDSAASPQGAAVLEQPAVHDGEAAEAEPEPLGEAVDLQPPEPAAQGKMPGRPMLQNRKGRKAKRRNRR
jgi:hypothetical protein